MGVRGASRGAPGATAGPRAFKAIGAAVVACRRCPRLREYCREVARTKVRRFASEEYWGRPVPGFGDPAARLLVVGLAPAAHGANRTGRMFTGDDSGAWLFRALHRAGFASQAASLRRDDGLRLRGAWVTAAARCAPPDNRPRPEELRACRGHLVAEMRALAPLHAILALGRVAFKAALDAYREAGGRLPAPLPSFAHGAEVALDDGPVLVASYHPSRQNTQTGRLTEAMLDAVTARARVLCDGSGSLRRRSP